MARTALRREVEVAVFRRPVSVTIESHRGVPSLTIKWTDLAVSHIELDRETMRGMYLDLARVNGYD